METLEIPLRVMHDLDLVWQFSTHLVSGIAMERIHSVSFVVKGLESLDPTLSCLELNHLEHHQDIPQCLLL